MTTFVTQKFRDTLAESHTVLAGAELLANDVVALDLAAAEAVSDGIVNVQNEAIQRSGTLTLVDVTGDLSPYRPDDLLAASSGNEIRLYRGVEFPDGSGTELPAIGTFRFTVSRARYPTIDLELNDRAWVIQGALIESTVTIPSGTNYVAAITKILNIAWGASIPTNFPPTDEVTGTVILEPEGDPWEVCRELAKNIGHRLFFDPMGVATMIPEPDPATDPPDWTLSDVDPDNLQLPAVEVTWDVSSAVTAVIVIGENSTNTATFRATARDDELEGRIGRRPIFIRDEKISSQPQAGARARHELRARGGVVKNIRSPQLVNPAMECGDVVRIVNQARGLDELVVADRFPIPLRASQATIIEQSHIVPTISWSP